MHNYFSSELTNSVMYFEIGLAIFVIGILVYGFKNYKYFGWKFFALAFGVFAFESLTGALWINEHLGKYAYYHSAIDISWVMTLTWTCIIMFSKMLFDTFKSKIPCILEYTKLKNIQKFNLIKEFIFVILFSSILGGLLLIYLKSIGVFSFGKEIQEIINSGFTLFGLPFEVIIYFPVFIFTTFSFYKYWELAMQDKTLFNNYKVNLSKNILISVIVITLIGYLLHPLLIVKGIGIYIFIILLFILNLFVTGFIVSIFKSLPLFVRFIIGTFIFTVIGSFILSFFVKSGYLIFSQSIMDVHTINTIQLPLVNGITDVEFGGILFFSYLMIAIVKYFKVITDSKDIKITDENMTFKGFKSLFINQK